MYTKEKFALIKSKDLPTGYRVSEKETRSFVLFDDQQVVSRIVEKLLAEGAEVYENEEEFSKGYPPLTIEERINMSSDFLLRAQKKE